ncbi:MAG: type I DNA topoisomerase [Defluviitaleaceae bacterium]|nr:type I DNA topoisomerase [Defluviitaleaceae bacterium]
MAKKTVATKPSDKEKKSVAAKSPGKKKKLVATKPSDEEKNLVIVESPAKAKTLKKFLGSAYKIEASVGHVRDLPKSELGVNIENDYEPRYITIRGKGEILQRLRKEAKSADKIYLATDPDREGEAISWHLMHALKLDYKNTSRVTFNEITKNAVKKSIKEGRDIDMQLVNAQQARRVLDRIVGYKISPLLWKKVKKGLSAGRVQSVALKLICEREEEIETFIPEEYWTLDVKLRHQKKEFIARYTAGDNGKQELKTKEDTDKVLEKAEGKPLIVHDVKRGTRSRKPPTPFTTSTLQQEASRLLNYATSKVMMVAQQLYEGVDIKGEGTVGLVTYIRTDSMRIADEAFTAVRDYIIANHGDSYAATEKSKHKSKGKSQDAHEAIRPTEVTRTPDKIKDSLTKEQFKLYKLIWERFVASQMTPALYDTLTIKIAAGSQSDGTDTPVIFRATGSVLKFEGYLAVYRKNEQSDKDVNIPDMAPGDDVTLIEFDPQQHFTQPPPRFSEAGLVKTMEELGIGRPSTYAATIGNISYRNYVSKENKVFFPTELGEIINEIMENNFEDIINVDFTAHMEENLDKVETGEVEWKAIVRSFYPTLDARIKEAEERIGDITIQDEVTDILCEACSRNMVIKMGRFGRFLACPGFPDCRKTLPLYEEAGVDCPECSAKVQIRKTKKGRKYFCCEKNCGFMSWNLPAKEKCPDCNTHMTIKGRKTKQIVCANADCGFRKEYIDEEE